MNETNIRKPHREAERGEERKDEGERQKRAWADAFGRAAPTYDRAGPAFFSAFGPALVNVAQLRLGQRVLDVAAGVGASLIPAATAVGPSGQVVGIDFAPPMVATLTAEIERCDLANATARVMDAERLTFPDATFDAVLCGFALFLFPDRAQALAEMTRVLRPGGHLAVSTWGANDPRWRWYEDLIAQTLQLQPGEEAAQRETQEQTEQTLPKLGPGLARAEGVRSALADVGLHNITVVVDAREFVYPNEEAWWAAQWSHGARLWLERLSPAALEQFKATAFARMQAFKTPDGFPLRLEALLGVGTRQT